MLVESAQMLANCYSLEELERAPKTVKNTARRHSYLHHGSSKWVLKSIENYKWLLEHAYAIYNESLYRGAKYNNSFSFVEWCANNDPTLPNTPFSKPFLAMPEIYKSSDPVMAYRNYYRNEKTVDKNGDNMAFWTNRSHPEWWI